MKPSWIKPVVDWKRRQWQSISHRFPGLRRKKYHVDPSEKQEFERLPSWTELGVDFVNRTTWHGLKYIAIPSRFLLRRIIWITILLCNAALFIYIMTTRKDYLMSHPSSITVEVSYKDVLPFSAITICNHNQYRLTEMQKLGLYDLLVNDMPRDTEANSTCGYYQFFPGICRIPQSIPADNLVHLNDTTRHVCMKVCEDAYDWYCSGFLYNRRTQSCQLSPYTGEWLEQGLPSCSSEDGLEFYRRIRCPSDDDIHCNFEDGACTLKNDLTQNDQWLIVEAEGHDIKMDNTLDLPSGHVANLLLTELRPGYKGRLQTPYMNTTGKCLELFYWLQVRNPSISQSATLSVILITEEREEKLLLVKSKGPKDWSRQFVTLPSGVYQVVVEGKRGAVGQSGISLDDIVIQDCNRFASNRNCKVTRRGRAYLGTINVTAAGEPCLPWDSISSPIVNRLPDATQADAGNYCRNIPQQDWEEPSCFVRMKSLTVRPMPCDIPYCECLDDSYFKCDNGMCLPRNLICDGFNDCLDGSDESEVCNNSRNIECYFDTDYKCGYESNSVGALTFLRVSASDLRYYYGASIISANVSALEQLMVVDSKLGQIGDQVQLVSPLWTFDHATVLRLTYLMMGSLPQPVDSKAGLYLYQYSDLHVPVRMLFNTSNFAERDLQIFDVCVPRGRYHLMFLGVQGIPYESDLALDIVKIVDSCDYPEIQEDDSFDCSFMAMCGYKFISTSALFTSSFVYTNNAFMKNSLDQVCSAKFGGVEGIITSPGYPDNYANNLLCNFTISEPLGVTIEISFLEFSVEPESDCLFDRLEIYDPTANRTKIYCGDNDLPPVFKSKGNVLEFRFITDNSVNNGRFKLEYKTLINTTATAVSTDFAIALRYSGSRPASDNIHSAKLISPPITLRENSCMTMILAAAANFTIKMAYLDNKVYTEKLLLESPKSLGGEWHKLWIPLLPSMANSGQFVVVFETASVDDGSINEAIINDIKRLDGNCRDIVTSGSLDCRFTDIEQCGYLDVSKNSVKWLRNYHTTSETYYMQAFFDPISSEEAVLQSINANIKSESCLKLTYYSSSQSVNIKIESIPSSFLGKNNTNVNTAGHLNFGNDYIQQDLPVGRYSVVFRTFLQGEDLSGDVEELRIYRVDILNGSCAYNESTVNTYCTFDNPNLCGYTSSYPSGESWSWVKFVRLPIPGDGRNSSDDDGHGNHDNVMLYNGSEPNPMKGTLLTPVLSKVRPELMTFELYTTSINKTSIEVYVESSYENSYTKLAIDGEMVKNQWTNMSVCLPAATDFRVMIVGNADAINFVAVDNVYLSTRPCSFPPETTIPPVCTDPDLSNCDGFHFSWSPQFDWRYTADIRNDTVIPSGDGCVRVYYEMEGVIVYNETGKQYMDASICDIYIKGLTTFKIDLWFEEIEIKNCTQQYLEIWRYDGNNFTSENKIFCQDLEKFGSDPLQIETDKVIQIRVNAYKGFPRFRVRYSYVPMNMGGLFLALHYIDPKNSGTFTINRIAQWASGAFYAKDAFVCLKFDMVFPFSLLEVEYRQIHPQNGQIASKTVLEYRGYKDDRISWANAAIEVPVEGSNSLVQFVFYVSVANTTFVSNVRTFVGALNSIYIFNGSCPSSDVKILAGSNCTFDRDDTCGYVDNSQESSRWVLQPRRASYSSTGNCKVTRDGREYVGNISHTISGRLCQRWDQQTPHRHNQDVADYFPDSTLQDAANHCRNPSNPFIVRSSWCYTMDPKQRREYCDIPYCLDYIMEAQLLATRANRAVLMSPPLTLYRASCLTFRYRLTSTLVELTVRATTLSNSVPDDLRTYSIEMEPTSYVWETGTIDLLSNMTRIYFVADKIDFTEFDQFISLDNISITDGSCVKQDVGVSEVPRDSRGTEGRAAYTGDRRPQDSYIDLVLDELKDRDMQVLTEEMAHQLPQLVHRCDYGQQSCTEAEFMTKFTDMGQCYTFNYDPNNFQQISSPGTESGARFIFNVEQYEHVKNYVSGVGVKVHLHDQNDIPKMRDLAVSTMPGVHTLATISYTQIDSLLPPFGSCGTTALPYFESNNETVTYTEAKCRMENKTRFIEEKCSCKDIDMPGPSSVCNLNQSINCIKQNTGPSLNASSSAVCPGACTVNSFSVGLSQSQLSGLDIDSLLQNRTEELRTRYLNALEVRHRTDEGLLSTTLKQIDNVISGYGKLRDYVFFAVLDRGTSIPRHVEDSLQSIADLVLNDIVVGGGGILSNFENAYQTSVKPRESYLREISTTVHARLSLSKDLFTNLKSETDLAWCMQIFEDTFRQLSEFSRTLVTHSQNPNTVTPYLPKLFDFPPCSTYTGKIIEESPRLIELFENFTTANSDRNCSSCSEIIGRIDEMLVSLSNFSDCNSEYSSFLSEFRRWLNSVTFDFKEFSNSINSEKVLNMFIHNGSWLAGLKQNYSQNQISKFDLAGQLLSETSTQLSQGIDNVIQEISQQIVVPLQNKLSNTEENIASMYYTFLTYLVKLVNYTRSADVESYARTLQIWRKPLPNLEVPEMLEFTLSRSETWQVWPTEQSMDSFVPDSAKNRLSLVSMVFFNTLNLEMTNFLTDIDAHQKQLTTSMDAIRKSLQDYSDSTQIDEKFVMQNFLMMDIYYGEMKYEHITQSESYTWTNFFSDLGSYFGLLMGCSLLTMIEVLDLVVYYAIVKLIERYQRPPPRREIVEINIFPTTQV